MTLEPHSLDMITGLVPDTEVSPVRVEVVDDQGVGTPSQCDVLSVVALEEVVELAAERLVRLRGVERELEESRATCSQLQAECELLRNEQSRLEAVLARIHGLQRRLEDVLDQP